LIRVVSCVGERRRAAGRAAALPTWPDPDPAPATEATPPGPRTAPPPRWLAFTKKSSCRKYS